MKNNSFTRTVAQINAGASQDELSRSMAELLTAVRATGKAGSLTYTIEVKPASRGDIVTVKLSDTIKLKMPKGERPETIFYINEDGGLQRNDPRQQDMEIRVAQDAPEPREVRSAAVNA
jgi:DnaJ-class molecular chaperone